jgi:hypothetical protein
MGGALSLGTAVAVSGAAASPNMGSISVSAALAMLMTLLNIRLGYWAPTPNQGNWLRPQARLWPGYMLTEFLSQTNDLFSYCYLTDGGHFENVGLYALVARGCRYLVVADCGADPASTFSDLGEAIRRCRIDFDAEIDLDITPLRRGPAGPAARHCVAGTIVYAERHVQRLGWADTSEAARTGIIVVFKPTMTDRGEAVDVRQYALAHDRFPQQSTLNQWFDEAQFESYRKLGRQAARGALEEALVAGAREQGRPPHPITDRAAIFQRVLALFGPAAARPLRDAPRRRLPSSDPGAEDGARLHRRGAAHATGGGALEAVRKASDVTLTVSRGTPGTKRDDLANPPLRKEHSWDDLGIPGTQGPSA